MVVIALQQEHFVALMPQSKRVGIKKVTTPLTTPRQRLQFEVQKALHLLFEQQSWSGDVPTVGLEPAKKAEHGDFACTIALALAKRVSQPPRQIADLLLEALGDAGGLLAKVEVAGPGFLNLFLVPEVWHQGLADILQRGPTFFHSQCGAGRKILIEYVSANPTGPLHIAHGRGAVTGNVLARLLKVTGHTVTSEYYINDRGRQIDIMAESIHLRYGACLGREFIEPEDFYPGEYITEMAVSLEQEFGDQYLDAPRSEWLPLFRERGVALMLERIKADLADFGIEFDHWVSETALMSQLDMPALLEQLRQAGYLYEEDGKQWLRSTELGDDKDRVVVRDDGRDTYFASDIAYHHDKAQRGFTELINIWGADHGGYIARVRAGLEACGDNAKALTVILVQMVRLSREGNIDLYERLLGRSFNSNDFAPVEDLYGVCASLFA